MDVSLASDQISASLALGKPLPKHVAIIMDGNRRWLKQRRHLCCEGKTSGHYYGVQVLPKIVSSAVTLGIKVLTLFVFSTENFSRSQEEVRELFLLFHSQLGKQLPFLMNQGVRLRCIGDLSKLPQNIQEQITHAEKQTENSSCLELVLAINYGAKDELVRAFKKLHYDLTCQKISSEDLSESLVGSYLDTAGLSDPDLLIRTGGEMRVSNFLLWQIAYTELYVTEVLWPDFTPQHFIDAIKVYQQRSRRGGK
ncbi:di-trans,poly-cis-decaprenylcistransferase [Chlamydia pecorum]|uniref:Isoprenyl transferase n=1 Tax=Chlamydia pecorum TaxID=85991 RepID=A0AA40PS66_9CHLA|nr:isoprenyl transferase [Chlamydia pecorum]KTF29236.1 di-trans,poly-cis-decaprenylcistransferase [Chlamydia pecorum]